MGKMKALWAEMREQEIAHECHYSGLPSPDFYKELVIKEPVSMDMPCPNCFNNKLEFNTTDDIQCTHAGCGHEFVLVDAKTLKFK
jgi:hypothetical protein